MLFRSVVVLRNFLDKFLESTTASSKAVEPPWPRNGTITCIASAGPRVCDMSYVSKILYHFQSFLWETFYYLQVYSLMSM